MSDDPVQKIADAVLYEGYILYPYRPSSAKNSYRWTFGVVYPRSFTQLQEGADDWKMQTECLLRAGNDTVVEVKVRFLQVIDEIVGEIDEQARHSLEVSSCSFVEPEFRPVASVQAGDAVHHTRQDTLEREVVFDSSVGKLTDKIRRQSFSYRSCRGLRTLRDQKGKAVGVVVRDQRSLKGTLSVSAQQLRQELFKLQVRVENATPLKEHPCPSRGEAVLRSFVSTHTILTVRDGEFVSLLDPPANVADLAAACENVGTWPVLVGDRSTRNAMLSSPIILYDYPQIAPESPGELFDGTEIDELLSLRVQTLTRDEKQEAATWDDRAKQLIDRTDSLEADQLSYLHGVLRGPRERDSSGGEAPPASVRVAGVELTARNRVRLKPRGGADAFDFLLYGKTATIESIEQDLEENVYVAVTVDDDPGKDLGREGKIGHRFFFRPDEIEPVGNDE